MKKHLTNFFLNSAPFFIGLLPSVLAIPIYLNKLGTEGLGIYYLYLAVVGIGGSFDLGITQTIIKYLSQYQDKSPIFSSLLIGSSVMIISFANVIITVAAIFVYGILYLFGWDGLPEISIIFLFILGLLLQMWFNFFLSILKGNESFNRMATVELINKLIFTGLGIVLAIFFRDVKYVLVAHILSLCIQNIYLLKILKPYNYNSYSNNLKFQFFKNHLWAYSKWILVQNTVGFLNGNLDKFLVASTVNLSSLAVYNTANNLARLIPSFFSKGLGYLLPHVSKITDRERVRIFYIKYSYIFNIVLSFIYLFVVIGAPYFISIYLNDKVISDEVTLTFRFLVIASIFSATSLLSFNVFNAIGEVKTNTVIPFLSNVISLLCVLIGGLFWGFWGIVFARLNIILLSTLVRTITYNKIFGRKEYWIGLKLALPLIIMVLLFELYHFMA